MKHQFSLVGRTRFELVTNGLKAGYAPQAKGRPPMGNAVHAAPKAPKTLHGWQKASCTPALPRLLRPLSPADDTALPFVGLIDVAQKSLAHR